MSGPELPQPDDHLLEEFLAGQSAVGAAYRAAAPEQAPAELDAAILQMARRTADQVSARRGRLRWPLPASALATAAVLVLSLGVLLQLQREPAVQQPVLAPPAERLPSYELVTKEAESAVPQQSAQRPAAPVNPAADRAAARTRSATATENRRPEVASPPPPPPPPPETPAAMSSPTAAPFAAAESAPPALASMDAAGPPMVGMPQRSERPQKSATAGLRSDGSQRLRYSAPAQTVTADREVEIETGCGDGMVIDQESASALSRCRVLTEKSQSLVIGGHRVRLMAIERDAVGAPGQTVRQVLLFEQIEGRWLRFFERGGPNDAPGGWPGRIEAGESPAGPLLHLPMACDGGDCGHYLLWRDGQWRHIESEAWLRSFEAGLPPGQLPSANPSIDLGSLQAILYAQPRNSPDCCTGVDRYQVQLGIEQDRFVLREVRRLEAVKP